MPDLIIPRAISDFLSECGFDNKNLIGKCAKFIQLLSEENSKYNLTSIKDEKELWIKHICDSAAIFRENRRFFTQSSKICDIGSGAGLPAVVIAIACDSTVYAVESTQKKADFIRKASSELGLNNLVVVNSRAEDMNKKGEYENFFDIITARAVAKLAKIISISKNMLSVDGRYIFYKTPFSAEFEIKDAKKKFKYIFFESQKSFSLPLQMGERVFITAGIFSEK